jgi:endonuclease/exonuclease/phosphatase family metal-dependent hydrolase
MNLMGLCIITSNIRFDNPADGLNAWPFRKFLLAETLLSHGPDIIATQEGRFYQLKEFEELLEHYIIVDHHRSWIKERMYPTFFVKKNVFEIIGSEDFWLSETPEIAGSISFNSTFPRLLTWIKVQLKNSEKKFILINTHLDHVKADTRIEQVKVLINKVKKLKDEKSYLIIMGDFNDSPDSEIRKIIMDSFPELEDGWKKFHLIEESSHHAFNGECQHGSRIDWILTDQRLSVEKFHFDKTFLRDRYPSDHFPVICKFQKLHEY